MATIVPVPDEVSQKWADAHQRLSTFLTNVFDPHRNSVPKEIPGVEGPRPISLPEHMAQMILFGMGVPNKDKANGSPIQSNR